jgi:hypothetical protein
MKNPLFIEMVKCIQSIDPYIHMDDMKIAAYLFCKDSYQGEHSEYYKLMCEIDFHYSCNEDMLADSFPDALCAYDILSVHFGFTH